MRSNAVLRISIQNDTVAATLRLEGKVIGPWARELNRVWSDLKSPLGVKKLHLDLCGVTLVDKSGTRTLLNNLSPHGRGDSRRHSPGRVFLPPKQCAVCREMRRRRIDMHGLKTL